MTTLRNGFLAFATLLFLGAGCSRSPAQGPDFSQHDPLQAAQKVQFLPDDTFEVQQTLIGGKEGTKQVTVTRFAPLHGANLIWQSTIERETTASQQRRQAYEKALLDKRQVKDLLNPPQVEMEQVMTTGTVSNMDLSQSFMLLLPSYWEAKDLDVRNEKSGLWLSDNTFMELSRTSSTIINLGFLDEAANRMIKNATELKAAYDRLKNNVQTEGKNKDLTLVEAEKQLIEWPLMINDKVVNVSAIRAKNWFGEFVILNNRQNPMVLSLKINPLAFGTAQALSGEVDVSKLFGFEVKNLTLHIEQ